MVARPGLSEEFVHDSSSEDESESETETESSEPEKSPEKIMTVSHKASANSKAESSGSSSESSSEETSESDSDTSNSTPTSNGIKRKGSTGKISGPVQKKSKSSISHPTRVPPAPYQPPSGYEPLRASQIDSTPVFDAESLSSKQIWHITAPASIPITSIKSLDMQAALRGEPVLEHNDTKYNIYAMPIKEETLLLPSETDQKYSRASVTITRNLIVREMTQAKQPPSSKQDKPQAASLSPATKLDIAHVKFTAAKIGDERVPRPKVKGLMMRYHPYGSSVTGVEKIRNPDQDEEEPEERLKVDGFRAPSELPMDLDTDTVARTPKSSKKSKKRDKQHTPKSSQVDTTNGDVMDVDTPKTKPLKDAFQEKKKKREKKMERKNGA